jgi:hypothetical protein
MIKRSTWSQHRKSCHRPGSAGQGTTEVHLYRVYFRARETGHALWQTGDKYRSTMPTSTLRILGAPRALAPKAGTKPFQARARNSASRALTSQAVGSGAVRAANR